MCLNCTLLYTLIKPVASLFERVNLRVVIVDMSIKQNLSTILIGNETLPTG